MLDGREDLREQFIVTIDPDDARDFDDAIHVEKLNGGGWRLGVHIADVSAYVTPGSALDREALQAREQRISARSRHPDVAGASEQRRLQLEPARGSADAFRFRPIRQATARTKSARFARTVIRSAQRLTYSRPSPFCRNRLTTSLSERLHTAWELAALLRRKRFAARLARSRFSGGESARSTKKGSRFGSNESKTTSRIN